MGALIRLSDFAYRLLRKFSKLLTRVTVQTEWNGVIVRENALEFLTRRAVASIILALALLIQFSPMLADEQSSTTASKLFDLGTVLWNG